MTVPIGMFGGKRLAWAVACQPAVTIWSPTWIFVASRGKLSVRRFVLPASVLTSPISPLGPSIAATGAEAPSISVTFAELPVTSVTVPTSAPSAIAGSPTRDAGARPGVDPELVDEDLRRARRSHPR